MHEEEDRLKEEEGRLVSQLIPRSQEESEKSREEKTSQDKEKQTDYS